MRRIKRTYAILAVGLGFLALTGTYFVYANRENDSIVWNTDLNVARQKAIASGKMLFLDFNAAWCGPCNRMKETTLKDSTVTRELQKYELVSVDFDANKNLDAALAVNSIPAFFIADPQTGKILKENRTGALPPNNFLAWLKTNPAGAGR